MPFGEQTAPGSSSGGTITGANNGLSVFGANVVLGHTANGGITGSSDFIDNRDIFLSTYSFNIAGTFGTSILNINGSSGLVDFTTTGADHVYINATALSILGIVTSSLGTTATNYKGFTLKNSTAATAGSQQISPNILWEGNGWKTAATAESQIVRFRADILPVQGVTNPSAIWRLSSSINGAAYNDSFTVDSLGNMITSGSYTIGVDPLITLTNAASITVSGTPADISFVLQPKGSGSILANKPTGTAVGGNVRGNYTIDLQLSRSAANMVASGANSIIIGGSSNIASSNYSIVLGGYNNISSGTNSAVIAANTSNATNSASLILGGTLNNASGQNACIIASSGSSASGQYSIVLGGYGNICSADLTNACGLNSTAYLKGMFSHANGYYSSTGDTQNSRLNVRKLDSTLTTGKNTILSLDGAGAIILPTGTNRVWNVQVNWIGVITAIAGTATGLSVGDVISETDFICLKKIGGISTLVDSPDMIIKGYAMMKTSLMTYSIGASNDLLMTYSAPVFAGGGTLTMRISGTIYLTEISY